MREEGSKTEKGKKLIERCGKEASDGMMDLNPYSLL